MYDPLISIIMPVYQVEKYIEKSLISVCRQKYKNIEIILVNDGSKDRSLELAKEILKKEKGISYRIISQKNRGVAAARNVGINDAKGEWIICVDSDDIITEDFISEMVEGIKKNQNIDLVINNYLTVKEKEECSVKKEITKYEKFSKDMLFELFLIRKIPIVVPAILIRRDFLLKHKISYDETMRFSEDLQYIWQLLYAVSSGLYIWNQRYLYVIHDNSIMSSSSVKKIFSGYEGMKRYIASIQDNKMANKIMGRWVFGAIHSSAKMLNYSNYKELLKKMSYKTWLNYLSDFEDFKVRILSHIFKMGKGITYLVCRII